jgi:hypothetical protein
MHFGTIQLLSSSSSFPVPGEGEGGHCESMRRGPPWESIEHGTTGGVRPRVEVEHYWRVAKRKDGFGRTEDLNADTYRGIQ